MTTIKRDDAIKIVETVNKHYPNAKFDYIVGLIKNKLLALPSTEVEWIPITTSEPTTSNHVLVTYNWGDGDYEVSELDYWVTKCAAEEGNKQCQMFIDHVIAWSFLPQPYKER